MPGAGSAAGFAMVAAKLMAPAKVILYIFYLASNTAVTCLKRSLF
jgi:hypothetical protein